MGPYNPAPIRLTAESAKSAKSIKPDSERLWFAPRPPQFTIERD
jgi:hypothetical protein